MAFIVTENCMLCKHTACALVCPVDCFIDLKNMLVIDPKRCIDCEQCVDACPIDAIYYETELPWHQIHMIKFNANQAKAKIDAGGKYLSTMLDI